MNMTRIISAVVGFPIVALLLVFGNKYLIDVVFAIIAVMSLHEFYNCFKVEKKAKPVTIIGYITCILIAFIHIIPQNYLVYVIAMFFPTCILLLFLAVIASEMKYNIKDISLTFFGICYITLFIMFVPILMGANNGKILVWYILFAAWGTDLFAYIVGKNLGKHKFSKISPNKSIEGCIGGVLGAVIFTTLYTYIINRYLGMDINYLLIIIIGIVLSLIGQIGDFSASSIKRYVNVKDFSNLIPGHGGMLDRIDSVIFIAPFAYFLLMLV